MLQTLCYGHYVTDITSRHDIMDYIMDIMTEWLLILILLGEINSTCKPILFKFITSKFTVLLTKH